MSETENTLTNRVILITGAGSGIGKATVEMAVKAGALVVATDVKGHDEVASEFGCTAMSLDVTDSANWALVVDDILAEHGRIDGLANIAGIISVTDALGTQTEDGWQQIIDVDLKGAFLGMRSVLQPMLNNKGGSIVNVASTAGLIGMPNVLTYSAAKGGIIAMSRQVAVEYAATGLRVNAVAPGVTKTPMLGEITDELRGAVIAATPVGRLGTPQDLANAIVFLLSDASSFITGQTIPVDGGWTAQ
ncbi:short-chain dehydrogenase [Rhodococcus sp. SC4]|nr:short-chain dehydrogenase [Rhodococcus sp. SC4]